MSPDGGRAAAHTHLELPHLCLGLIGDWPAAGSFPGSLLSSDPQRHCAIFIHGFAATQGPSPELDDQRNQRTLVLKSEPSINPATAAAAAAAGAY